MNERRGRAAGVVVVFCPFAFPLSHFLATNHAWKSSFCRTSLLSSLLRISTASIHIRNQSGLAVLDGNVEGTPNILLLLVSCSSYSMYDLN